MSEPSPSTGSGPEWGHDWRLRLFSRQRSAAYRRRRLIFLALYGLVVVGLTLPLFPAVWGIRPWILGLPTSLAWVSLALAVVFVGLLWLYLAEERD